jgi:hypothetical protein
MYSETSHSTLPPGFEMVPGLLSTAALLAPFEAKPLLEGYPVAAREMADGRWILAGDVGPFMWARLNARDEQLHLEAALTPSPDSRRLLAISHYMIGAMHRFVLSVDDARTQAFLRSCLTRQPLFCLGQAGGDAAMLKPGEMPHELVHKLLKSGNVNGRVGDLPPVQLNKGVVDAQLFVAPVQQPQLKEISISMPEALILSCQGPLH